MAVFPSHAARHIHPTILQTLSGHFSDEEMAALSQLGTIADLDAGQKFADEGAVGREAVVVLSGTADVVRDGEIIATVGVGSVLGEIALLTNEPRSASLIARDALSISVMSQREFDSFLAQCPRLAAEIVSTSHARAAA